MSVEDWDDTETITIGAGNLFAAVILCPEGGHWAWYVINDETGILLASGSDDEREWAIQNAEGVLEKYDALDSPMTGTATTEKKYSCGEKPGYFREVVLRVPLDWEEIEYIISQKAP